MSKTHSSRKSGPPPNDSMSAIVTAFPQTPKDFKRDPRVSFDKLQSKWILETEDGQEWEWQEQVERWAPSYDDDAIRQQASAYAVQGVDENAPAFSTKKRKQSEEGADGKAQKKTRNTTEQVPRKPTAVYATSLPLDATVEEIQNVFGKCGLIAESIDSEGEPRIKMYKDDQGRFKGDALIVYFRPESVPLAIQMLDESDFRFNVPGPNGQMRVQLADTSYKRDANNKEKEKDEGQNDATKARRAKPKLSEEKRKAIEKQQRMNDKLADWSDDEPSAITETSTRFDKIVILKHMFTLDELAEDPAALLDIKEDIRGECEKFGTVTNVVLYDLEEAGVVTVRFSDSTAARACIKVLDGRNFGGQAVKAYIADGSEKFRKAKVKKDAGEDEDEERAEQFGDWLEAEQ